MAMQERVACYDRPLQLVLSERVMAEGRECRKQAKGAAHLVMGMYYRRVSSRMDAFASTMRGRLRGGV